MALRGLDIVKSWYDFTHELITGRSALIVAASFLGWGAEIITLRALSIWMHISFGLGDFASYIEAVLLKRREQSSGDIYKDGCDRTSDPDDTRLCELSALSQKRNGHEESNRYL